MIDILNAKSETNMNLFLPEMNGRFTDLCGRHPQGAIKKGVNIQKEIEQKKQQSGLT